VDDEIAHLIDPLALVPGDVGIELHPERRGEHRGCQILHIVGGLGLGHAEAMVLRNIPVMRGVARPGEANSGRDMAPGFIGLGARHHAEGDLARAQHADANLAIDEFAIGGQDRGDADQVLLLDIGVAQRKFEGGQPLPVDADAAGQEHALGERKHWPTSLWLFCRVA